MIPLLIFKEEAKDDVLSAAEWDKEKQAGLDERFMAAIEETTERILKHPSAGRLIYKSFRQTSLKKFPYVIVYENLSESIIIYSVFHTSQNPGKKIKRLKK
jgi:plasmid stabilization system protein ParE